MSQATETAKNALRIYAAYPPHVRDREQSRYLKELADHVIRLEQEIEEIRNAVTVEAGKLPWYHQPETFSLPAPEDYDDDDPSCESTIG